METILRYSLAIISFIIVIVTFYLFGIETNIITLIIGAVFAFGIRFTVAELLIQKGYVAKYMKVLNSILYFVASFVISVLIMYIVLSICGVPESYLGSVATYLAIVISLALTYRSAKKHNHKIEEAVDDQL